jgi:hypothetical protein
MEILYPFDKNLYSNTPVTFKIKNNVMEDSKVKLKEYKTLKEFLKENKEEFENQVKNSIKYLEEYTTYSLPEKDFMSYIITNNVSFIPVDFSWTFLNKFFEKYEKIKNNFEKYPKELINDLEQNIKNFYYLKILQNFQYDHNVSNKILSFSTDLKEKLIKLKNEDTEENWKNDLKKIDIFYRNQIVNVKDYLSLVQKLKYKDRENFDDFLSIFLTNFKPKIDKYFEFINILGDKIQEEDFMIYCFNDILKSTSAELEIAILPSILTLALMKENRKLKDKIEDLETQIKYMPEHEGYYEALQDFNNKIESNSKETDSKESLD